MEAVSSEELEALKYSELQRLAKTLGLKANLKADKLLSELKQHIHEIQEMGSMKMIENEESQDAGSQKRQRRSQNEFLVNSRMTENLDENSATPRSQKENCTIQKRVEGKTPVDYSPGKELCYSGSLSRSRKRQIKATTPNFKKIHEAQFKKMQSIDDYMEKKKKRIYNFSSSVNKTKAHSSGFLLSPCPPKRRLSITCTPKNLKHTPHSNLCQKSAFISTGFSTTKMNVRFSESTKDNEHKRSLTKTPSQKYPFLNSPTSSSQKNNRVVTRKKLTGTATESSMIKAPTTIGVTPSKVTTQAYVRTKKPVFDLQASLSRPLRYQPHRGKLKPWGESKENDQYTCSHRRNYKQPLLQTRDERRKKHAQERKQRKDQVLEARRGLAIV